MTDLPMLSVLALSSGSPDVRPLAAVLVPVLAIVLIIASYRRPNLRDAWSVLGAVLQFGIVASMVPGILGGTEYRWSMGGFVFGIEFALRADALGVLFALLATFLYIFTAFYAIGYMRGLEEHGQTRFFAAFAGALAAAVGVAFAENLLVVFVFFELLTVVTYPLVAHDETAEARAAARKYFAYLFFGGGVLVLGGSAAVYWATATYTNAGTVTFGATTDGLAALFAADPLLAQAIFGMLALGFGAKAAIMPLHSWLPDAMVAPTPVSGLLHAVAVVKTGAFGVARTVLDVFEPSLAGAMGIHLALAALAAVSFLVASVIALRKDHLKRRLAYSTASQLSYIIMGIALLTPYGIVGGLLHIPAHAFMKLTLFFAAGAIHVETHTDYISDMAGIGKRMPLTMGAFTLAAAGMAGIPLIAGFVSKFYILVGAVSMEAQLAGLAFAAALLVSGVLNIAYFWPVVYTAFFESEDQHDAKPLIESSLGGRTESYGVLSHMTGPTDQSVTDGGRTAVDDSPDESPGYAVDYQPSDADVPYGGLSPRVAHDADGHDETHHGGPPLGGWDRRQPWTESTWLMTMPITVVVLGAVVLGIVPGSVAFLDLTIEVAESRLGIDLPEVIN